MYLSFIYLKRGRINFVFFFLCNCVKIQFIGSYKGGDRVLTLMLEDLIAVPQKEVFTSDIQAGDRVKLVDGFETLLCDYYATVPNGNLAWTKMVQVLQSRRKAYFSVLHVADHLSAYPIGTVIIEIDANEDLEVNGEILEKYIEQQ